MCGTRSNVVQSDGNLLEHGAQGVREAVVPNGLVCVRSSLEDLFEQSAGRDLLSGERAAVERPVASGERDEAPQRGHEQRREIDQVL